MAWQAFASVPLLLFLCFSSRLSKPKEQDKFIKAHCSTKSWNVQGVSKHIVPLLSFSPNAPGESRKTNQPTQLCTFFFLNINLKITSVQRQANKEKGCSKGALIL